MGARSSTRKPSEISWHRVKGRKVCIIRCPRNTSAPFNCCASTANEELGNRSKLVVCGTWTDLGPCLVSVVWDSNPPFWEGKFSSHIQIPVKYGSTNPHAGLGFWTPATSSLQSKSTKTALGSRNYWAQQKPRAGQQYITASRGAMIFITKFFACEDVCVVLVTCHVLSMLALFMLNPAIFITCLQWL